MQENLIALSLDRYAQVAVDGIHEWVAPRAGLLVGVSVCASNFPSAPTTFTIDVNDDTVAMVAALAASTAGTPGTWWSKELGGTNDPVAFAKDSVIAIDVNFTGGSTPTATYTIVLFVELGQA